MSNHKGYIGGGCFKDIFMDKNFRDVDIFFRTVEDYNEALDFYKNNTDYTFVYENNNAICYKNNKTRKKIELVKSKFAEPEEMLDSFDFTIVKFVYYKEYDGDEIVWKYMYHPTFFEDLINKKLVINEDTTSFPLNTFERTYKYRKYGFGMCRETKQKLINMLQGVNTEDLGRDLYFGFD
jgi:hypothetical protein